MIIECPLNGQYHDHRSDTVTVTECSHILKLLKLNYDEQKSRNVIITESDGLEMTMSEK